MYVAAKHRTAAIPMFKRAKAVHLDILNTETLIFMASHEKHHLYLVDSSGTTKLKQKYQDISESIHCRR